MRFSGNGMINHGLILTTDGARAESYIIEKQLWRAPLGISRSRMNRKKIKTKKVNKKYVLIIKWYFTGFSPEIIGFLESA
jgi:hypothetical protein